MAMRAFNYHSRPTSSAVLCLFFIIFSNTGIFDISACLLNPLSTYPRRAINSSQIVHHNQPLNNYYYSSANNSSRRRTPTAGARISDQDENRFISSNGDVRAARFYKGNNLAPVQPSRCGHSRYYRHAGDSRLSSIVGGLAALPHELPWVVRLQIINPANNATQLCSANILSEFFMTTAAHCVAEVANSPQSVIGVVGEHDLLKPINRETGKMAVAISRIFIHPNYSSATNDNDISLLKADRSLLMQSEDRQVISSAICLPQSCQDGCGEGVTATIAGWGATSEVVMVASTLLQKAYVPIISSETCSKSFAGLNQKITSKMICAGMAVGGTDSCFGDSGGPLMSAEKGYFQLCGITSFGDGCGKSGVYGVYTRICAVLSWLNSVLSSTEN